MRFWQDLDRTIPASIGDPVAVAEDYLIVNGQPVTATVSDMHHRPTLVEGFGGPRLLVPGEQPPMKRMVSMDGGKTWTAGIDYSRLKPEYFHRFATHIDREGLAGG